MGCKRTCLCAGWVLLVHLVPSVFSVTPAQATEVMLFTAEGLPAIKNQQAATTVWVLGQTHGLLQSLRFTPSGVPENSDDTTQLKKAAIEHLNQPTAQGVLKKLRERANAAAMAKLLGIERLPAVLVSPGYVVYGVYDVATALEKVEAYRATQ